MTKNNSKPKQPKVTASGKSKDKPTTLKRKLMTVLSYVASLAVFYWLFFVLLPSEIDFSQVKTTITSLSALDSLAMLVAGIASIFAIGWTAATVLPGVKVKKATQASVVGQLTAVIMPPPADMVIRFGMYKTYGFSIDKSATAVVLSGIARYFTVVGVALLGLLAMLISGQGSVETLFWLVIGTAIFAAAVWIMGQILSGKKAAEKVGILTQDAANWLLGLIKRKPLTTFDKSVVRFSVRSKGVVDKNLWQIALSNLVWGLSCYAILLLAVRFCGINGDVMSASYLLLITGVMLMLNSLPIPGSGVGVTETILLAAITFPNAQTQSAFTAALFLYRIYTWLLPFPVGAVSYFVWRYQLSHGTAKQTA